MAIERNCHYSVAAMCRFFGVSRSGYYAFIKQQRAIERDGELAALISQCQQQTHGTYGYRRVWLWLKRRDVHANHKAVLRIMNKYGLLSQIRRRRKYRQMGEQVHRYANHLDRNFVAIRPNEKWVTDISYVLTKQGTLYLSVILDLYDDSVVVYRFGTEQTVNLVLKTIQSAIEKEAATGVLLHSDQGFQYTSQAYFVLTERYGITASMSRRGNCYDNSMAESFFGTLKAECLNRQDLETIDQAKEIIDDFIYFYNSERIQLKTKLTPLEKRRQFA